MLSDKDIEKRMVEALDEGGRHTVDELVKSTGIDEKRIWKALQALETEELCAHITLEGTPRFYITAAHIKDDSPPKVRKKYQARPKIPCPKCGGMYDASGLTRHQATCKGPITRCPISQLPKGAKVACSICGDLFDPRGLGPHKRACKGKKLRGQVATVTTLDEMYDAVDKVIDRETGAISTAHLRDQGTADASTPMTATYSIPPLNYLPGIVRPPESEQDRGVRLQDLGELIGEKHWDNFLGAEKRHEYINGFQHGFKHGYEHRIKEEEEHAKG